MIYIKYAYLIIADHNKKQLQKLITMLDDSRNDIYLLIDKKSSLSNCSFIVNYSNIYYLKSINIYWGSYSLIRAELHLFYSAFNNGHYIYYHLISGQDLPLVNQDEIHKFFDEHRGYEFIQYQIKTRKGINDKLNYHFFRKSFDKGLHSDRSNNIICKLLWSIYRRIEMFINMCIPEHKIPFEKVSVASQWMSIDDDLVKTILNSKKWIYSKFHSGKVVDEIFIPTLINYYPSLLKKVYDTKSYNVPNNPLSNLRYIKKKAKESHPYVWTINDYKDLKKARDNGYLFSRKFDSRIDNKIITKIFNDVMYK